MYMKFIASLLFCLLYFFAVVGLGSISGPTSSLWLTSILSVFFLITYWRLIRRRLIVPLAAIFVITIVAPISILFAIGLPHYRSGTQVAEALIASLRNHGEFWGLEIFLPVLVAMLAGFVLRRAGGLSELPAVADAANADLNG
jgi:hypothetical protein